jgi:hypothetical protein
MCDKNAVLSEYNSVSYKSCEALDQKELKTFLEESVIPQRVSGTCMWQKHNGRRHKEINQSSAGLQILLVSWINLQHKKLDTVDTYFKIIIIIQHSFQHLHCHKLINHPEHAVGISCRPPHATSSYHGGVLISNNCSSIWLLEIKFCELILTIQHTFWLTTTFFFIQAHH